MILEEEMMHQKNKEGITAANLTPKSLDLGIDIIKVRRINIKLRVGTIPPATWNKILKSTSGYASKNNQEKKPSVRKILTPVKTLSHRGKCTYVSRKYRTK